MAKWRNGEMAKWRNGEMAKWRNGEMAKWRNGEMAKWRNGEMEAQAYWGGDVGIGERGIHRLKGCFIFE